MRPALAIAICLLGVFSTHWYGGHELAHAGDGRLGWYTVESEHFLVHYHEPLGDVARRVAMVAERAHAELVPALGHAPAEKTLIVIEDFTDGSNGFASVLPRNSIRLFASAPPSKSDLADHDDWLYALTAHEYTHILHLDTIDGLPKYVNKVVGKTWAPNQIMPRWIIEGLATYEESRYTSGGRTRHPLFDMNLRLSTLEGDERSLDEMTNGPRAWPHGNTAYLYGSHFLKYVFDRYGEDKVAEMSYQGGSSPIPYGVNLQIQRAIGEDFVDLHDDWIDYRRDRYGLQAEAVERAGRREGRRLTFSSEVNINPRYTRDGKNIIWQHGNGFERGQYAIMPAGGTFADRKKYAAIRRTGEYDVLSDGSLILEQTDIYRAVYSSQELYRWDPRTEEMQRLTKRTRLRDPAVSPDERWVAFVMTEKGRRRLARMKLQAGAEPEILWAGDGDFDQAFDPAWSPDGKRLAFSSWRQGGYRDIMILDLESGELTELAKDRAQDVDPVWDPKGRYLYYSSDRTGIFNVYAYDLQDGSLQQVTNVMGCALSPTVSPDGKKMVYHGYVARGFELYEMSLDPNAWTEAPLYINDRPDPVVIENKDYPVSEARPYRPIETLAPRTYSLQLDAVNQRLGVQVSGSDIVGLHSYNLGVTGDYGDGHMDVGATYTYSRNWANFRLGGLRSVGARGGLFLDGRNTRFDEERLGATASLSLPVFRHATGSASLSLDYDFDYFRTLDDELVEPDPNDILPRLPESDVKVAGVAARFSYSDIEGYVYTLGPQRGKTLNLSMRVDHPSLGSDFTSLNLDYRFHTYWRMPWGRTPVLSMRFNGGIRTGNRERVSQFTLGGVPQQDVVQSVLGNLRAGNTGFLRGYEFQAAVGRQMHLMNMEYRQELWNIEWGLATLPLYLRKIHWAGLFDVGNAFDDEFDPRDFKASVGAAMRMDILVGYFIPGSLDIGYARGLTDDGINEFWTLLTGTL